MGSSTSSGAHRAGDADRDRLLAERHGICAEPAGALQRDRLQVEGARQHHRAIERNQKVRVGGKGGERPVDRAVRREIVAVSDLETRDYRKLVVRPVLGHPVVSRDRGRIVRLEF